jgi:hypothetical protein
MITQSLGYVLPTSTTVATIATTNVLATYPGSLWVQAVSFQALKSNTGSVYICDRANPNFTTGIGILWEVPKPTAADGTSLPAWVIGDPSRGNNPVNVAQFYILPTNSGEGVRVSAIRSGTSQTLTS